MQRKNRKKKALQAVFSAEIIYGAARHSYLKGISETDDIYGHCYVLEYSAQLARDFLNCTSGIVDVNAPYYQKLYSYSGLNGQTLVCWLDDMIYQHKAGKQIRTERSNALTVKSKPVASMPSPAPVPFTLAGNPSYVSSSSSNYTRSVYPKATPAEQSRFFQDAAAKTNQLLQLPPAQLQSLGNMVIPPAQLAEYAKEWNRMGILPDEDFANFQSKQASRHATGMEDYTSDMFGQNLPAHIQRQIDEAKRQIADQRGRFPSGGFAASAVRMPAPPAVQSKGGEWTETFDLKGGGTAMRTPTSLIIKKGNFQSTGPRINMSNCSMNGTTINFHASTDMTREEFVAALRRDGNL
jgi:hypothetical protein